MRHLLSVLDLSPVEFRSAVDRTIEFARGSEARSLRGLFAGIYFKTSSTRTRTAFTVAANRLGASIIAYGPGDLQINTGESLSDTANVLSRFLDVLVVRTSGPLAEMNMLAAQRDMAIINAMSDNEHPTQALTDLAVMQDAFGELGGLHVLYLGEGNNTAAALALAISRIPDMSLTLLTPAGYGLQPEILFAAQSQASKSGASIVERHEVSTARPADVVYTTRWQTTGTSKADPDWRKVFAPFAVTSRLFAAVSRNGTVFMHDLPAVRNEDVETEVLDGPRSLALRQAEFKLYGAMAALEWCVEGTHKSAHPAASEVASVAL